MTPVAMGRAEFTRPLAAIVMKADSFERLKGAHRAWLEDGAAPGTGRDAPTVGAAAHGGGGCLSGALGKIP